MTSMAYLQIFTLYLVKLRVCNKKYYSYFSTKTYVVGTQRQHVLVEY